MSPCALGTHKTLHGAVDTGHGHLVWKLSSSNQGILCKWTRQRTFFFSLRWPIFFPFTNGGEHCSPCPWYGCRPWYRRSWHGPRHGPIATSGFGRARRPADRTPGEGLGPREALTARCRLTSASTSLHPGPQHSIDENRERGASHAGSVRHHGRLRGSAGGLVRLDYSRCQHLEAQDLATQRAALRQTLDEDLRRFIREGIIAVTDRDDTQVVIDALRGYIRRQRNPLLSSGSAGFLWQEAANWGVV